ncbi:O-Antigen ligase [Maioricimonas rarisocia]|uniref:O-Antigen ligase n=1 Tax=Maioricimonas rarisocia TaxID=2528026 RepID=A0A517ZC99_9PLAN|nr:O-antigen ligase family protein [Maioricimonas rarisocia]QDU40079.1 O-Antigen ligase [Maioricimonas rarisocia]
MFGRFEAGTSQWSSGRAKSRRRGFSAASTGSADTHAQAPPLPPRMTQALECEYALQRILLRLVDASLAAAIVVIPMLMGGRLAFGQVAFTVVGFSAAILWCLLQLSRQNATWHRSLADPLLLVAIGLGVLQVIQLPPALLNSISPELQSMLPLWQEGVAAKQFGTWTTLSVVPAESLSTLIPVIAGILLFWTFCQRIHGLADVERLLTWCLWSSILMAGFGLLQFVASNGRFFWFFDYPHTDTWSEAKGAFSNPNHFGMFLAMGMPLACWKLFISSSAKKEASRESGGWGDGGDRWEQLHWWCVAGGVPLLVAGLLLSQSRSAAAVAGAAVVFQVILFWKFGAIDRRSLTRAGLMIVVVGLSVVASLGVMGQRLVQSTDANLRELASLDVDKMDASNARRKIWGANLQGIGDFPLVGTGLGSHREVYYRYLDQTEGQSEYSHAENGYLQVALESGLIGLAIVVGLILILLDASRRLLFANAPAQARIVAVTVTAGLLANLLQSIVDFVWYVPGCMVVVVVFAAGLIRLAKMARAPDTAAISTLVAHPPVRFLLRGAWGGATVFLFGATLAGAGYKWSEVEAEPYWFEYIRLVNGSTAAQADPEDLVADSRILLHQRIVNLLKAARANPRAHRIQLRAASAWRKLFELGQEHSGAGMTLDDIEAAVVASAFESVDEMNQWLDRPGVIGENRRFLEASMRQVERSLRLCPLQARGYVALAELGWLRGDSDDLKQAMLDQAIAARPYDARVRLAVGKNAWLQGTPEEAIDHWRVAFRNDREVRQMLIRALSGAVPASFFLENFDIDAEVLVELRGAYDPQAHPESYVQLSRGLAEALLTLAREGRDGKAVEYYGRAHRCLVEIDEVEQATAVLQEAVAEHPYEFDLRRRFGMWCLAQQDFEQAAKHLTWCLNRRPNDPQLQQQAELATRSSLQSEVIHRAAAGREYGGYR